MAASQIWQDGTLLLPLQTGKLGNFDAGQAQIAALLVTCGTYVATGSAVTVAAPSVTASSQILITLKTAGGTVSSQFVQTITPGTGFTVDGGASDTSTYNYAVIG